MGFTRIVKIRKEGCTFFQIDKKILKDYRGFIIIMNRIKILNDTQKRPRNWVYFENILV